MIWTIETQRDVGGDESDDGDPCGSKSTCIGLVSDGDGPVLRGCAGEGLINEALVKKRSGFRSLRLVVDGREQE